MLRANCVCAVREIANAVIDTLNKELTFIIKLQKAGLGLRTPPAEQHPQRPVSL